MHLRSYCEECRDRGVAHERAFGVPLARDAKPLERVVLQEGLATFGALTGMAATSVQANQPTPWLGVWQRINIAAYMVWIAVLTITLLRSRAPAGPTDGRGAAPATAMAA